MSYVPDPHGFHGNEWMAVSDTWRNPGERMAMRMAQHQQPPMFHFQPPEQQHQFTPEMLDLLGRLPSDQQRQADQWQSMWNNQLLSNHGPSYGE